MVGTVHRKSNMFWFLSNFETASLAPGRGTPESFSWTRRERRQGGRATWGDTLDWTGGLRIILHNQLDGVTPLMLDPPDIHPKSYGQMLNLYLDFGRAGSFFYLATMSLTVYRIGKSGSCNLFNSDFGELRASL